MELVVGASQATMKSLLGKLGDLLAQEYALLRGVRGDIQFINDELAGMQAFLINLGTTGTDDHDAQTKDWMKQVRDIAYDIEDCIDDFIRRLPNDPQGTCLAEIRMRIHELWTCSPRRDIAEEIAGLKNRAQQVGERRTRYGVKNPESGRNNTAARSIGFDAAEDQLATRQLVGIKEPVGMDKDEELAKWVTNNDKNGVLSISGFGGVGKTTIAMALYRKYGDQFDRRAMVTVSQGSDLEAILRSILRQVKPQANNHGQLVSSGASSKERCGFLKIKLRPVMLWFQDQKQQCSHGGGSSEEKLQVARTHDNEQQDSSGGRYGERGSLEKNNQVMQWVHSRNLQGHGGSDDGSDDGSAGSSEDKNKVMQRVHSRNRQGSSGNASSYDEKNLMAFVKDILVHVMSCAAGYGNQRGRSSERDELVKELEEHLGKNRYFLLIDDIWSATTWQNIKKYLPPGKSGSKIIVTTRFQAVATACNQDQKMDKVHAVEALGNKEAARLFEEVVSESRSTKAGQRKKFDKAPDRIWEMCGGLPLAIVTMAGHVACNPHNPRKKWNEVCKSLFPEMSDTRFKKDKSDTLTPEGVTKILNYCYNDLPADINVKEIELY